jgi:hypothetical protein
VISGSLRYRTILSLVAVLSATLVACDNPERPSARATTPTSRPIGVLEFYGSYADPHEDGGRIPVGSSTGALDEAWFTRIDSESAEIPDSRANSCDELRGAMRAQGATDVGWSDVVVTIGARQNVFAKIINARARVERVREPDRGRVGVCVPDEESYVDYVEALTTPNYDGNVFLADKNGDAALFWREGEEYGNGLELRLAPGESQAIGFRGFASKRETYWMVELEIEIDGVKETVQVGNGAGPFHTAPAPERLRPDIDLVWCAYKGLRWIRPDPVKCSPPARYETPIY